MRSPNVVYDALILEPSIREMVKNGDAKVKETATEFVQSVAERKLSYTQFRAAVDIAHEIVRNLPLTNLPET